MSLNISSINTGSNGNCFYIGNEKEAILVDAGISCRETEKRMKRQGLSMENVKAIFVSHEHSDHISGVPGLSKKYQLPVYITDHTYRESRIPLAPGLVRSFAAGVPVMIGDMAITAFRKSHDAMDPHSFVIAQDQVHVGVFTDIGYSCQEVIKYFSRCDAVFLESNYCEQMLSDGNYPYYLKQRIRGDRGHLSNDQALELFKNYRGRHLSHLILSHLSKNNNKPELVEKLFSPVAGPVKVVVASRYQETPVYKIVKTTYDNLSFFVAPVQPVQVQLSLF